MRDLFDTDPEDPGPCAGAEPALAPAPAPADGGDGDGDGEAGDAASDATALAEGFARHVAAWAAPGLTADERALLADAARRVSLAASAGHVCADLAQWRAGLQPARGAAELQALLRRSGVVGTPAEPGACPLILDLAPTPDACEGRLYLHRHFDLERRLAARIVAAAATPLLPVADEAAAAVRSLFPAPVAGGQVDWQQLGAALALTRRLTVISGGPGTGKTTTLVNLLAALLQQAPQTRIALAAPTGKAAARMTDAVRARARALDPAIAERLPAQGSTIHRLLGWSPQGWRHGAAHPLPIDALVVDEASMLDLALATQLLEAVPPEARIILLGDKDQLAAVESGSVFADLSADPGLGPACRERLAALCGIAPSQVRPPAPLRATGLTDSALWFTRNYRFAADSGIGRLAAAIRDGQVGQALAGLRAEPASAELGWLDDPGGGLAEPTLAALEDGYAAYLDALRRDPADVAGISAAFDRFRVLCALRTGPRGAGAVNEHLTRHLRRQLAGDARLGAWAAGRSPWWPGRPVMVQRNDYGLGLFNGDIGITLPGPDGAQDGLWVYFPATAQAGGFRAVAPARLPAHDTAFAMTVHKSQGSEFAHALVLLPGQRHPLCTRELLYTGVTRARDRVTLVGGADVVAAAIGAPTRRLGGLPERLRDLAAAQTRSAMA